MELPVRKHTRLREHDYSQPGYYFITICTHNRQSLFTPFVGAHLCVRPPADVCFPVRWLYELEQKYPGIEIDCCAVMPDHIHFILAVTGAHIGAPLQEMIKWYKTQTTNEYIRQPVFLINSSIFQGSQKFAQIVKQTTYSQLGLLQHSLNLRFTYQIF